MTDDMPHDDELQAAYRRLPADEPPAEIDAAILGAARRRGDEERRRRRIRRIRLSVPLAAAAGVILTLTLTRLGDDRRGALPPLGESSAKAPGLARQMEETRPAAEMDQAESAGQIHQFDTEAGSSAQAPAAAPAPPPVAMAKPAAPSPQTTQASPQPRPRKERADAGPVPKAPAESAPGSSTEGGSHRSLGYIEGVPPVAASGDAEVGGEAREPQAGAAELHDETKASDSAASSIDETAKRAARDSAAIAALADSAPAPNDTARLAARRQESTSAAPAAPNAAPWPFGLEAALDADEACRRTTAALRQACAFRDGVAVVTVDPPTVVDRGALAGRRVSLLTLTLKDGRLSRIALKLPSPDGASIEEVVLDAATGTLPDR